MDQPTPTWAVDVSITGNQLVLAGEKKETAEHTGKDVHVSETRYGSFRRTIPTILGAHWWPPILGPSAGSLKHAWRRMAACRKWWRRLTPDATFPW